MHRSAFDYDPILGAFARELRDVVARVEHRPSRELGLLLSGDISTDKGDLPATAGSNVHGSATGQRAGLPHWRRRMLELITTKLAAMSLVAKVGVGTAVATTAAVGGTAVATDSLPSIIETFTHGDDRDVAMDASDDAGDVSVDASQDDAGSDLGVDGSDDTGDFSFDASQDPSGSDMSMDYSDRTCDYSYDVSVDEDGTTDVSEDVSCDEDDDAEDAAEAQREAEEEAAEAAREAEEEAREAAGEAAGGRRGGRRGRPRGRGGAPRGRA